MLYSYKHGFSGFAAKLTDAQAKQMAELPSVVRVIPNTLHKLHTTRSWDSLGLTSESESESESNLLQRARRGDGIIIGVVDTGIWPESKSFDELDLGPVPSRWKGVCKEGEQFDPARHCNRKIIGARWYINGYLAEYNLPLNSSGDIEFLSARDTHGHGTHTASTAAGALVSNISFKGLARGTARGGASNARVAVYKVCWNILGGLCSEADVLKAFDDAIHDGVDVVSISLGTLFPLYSEVDQRDGIVTGSFHAVEKGISVVSGAGNDGPADQKVQNTAPWIMAVAATSIDRAFVSSITLGNNQTMMGQALFVTKQIGFTGLAYPESKGFNPTGPLVCEALTLNGTNVAGKVVLCFTSVAPQTALISAASVVKEAGGVGLIVAKNPSDSMFPCPENLPCFCSGLFPCVQVDFEVGARIVLYIRSTRFPLVKLSPSRTVVGKPVSSKVAYFSSRGPSSASPAILKPDIAAPGVNILAATSPHDKLLADNGFAMNSGTSMSTPHVSAIVALLKAIHPSWSPAAIKSSLITTAWQSWPPGQPIFAEGTPQKLADPFDFGGGIVNPNAAADPGLVYDMGTLDYINYLCAMDYNNSAISHLTGNDTNCPVHRPSVLDVNLPSITIPSIGTIPVVVTRTVTNVGPSNSVYRVSIEAPYGISVAVKPQVLVFNSTVKKLTFEITITTTYQMETGFLFGSLTWTGRDHIVRIPLSVRTKLL